MPTVELSRNPLWKSSTVATITQRAKHIRLLEHCIKKEVQYRCLLKRC